MAINHISPSDPERWALRSKPPLLLIAVGLLIFLSGVYLFCYGLGIEGFSVGEGGDESFGSSGRPASRPTMLWLGLAYILGGLVMILGRRGVVIDKRLGIARRWYGLLFPFRRREFPLTLYNRLAIRREEQNDAEGGTIVSFPVGLAGPEGAAFPISAPAKEEAAREIIRELSNFLGWPAPREDGAPERFGVKESPAPSGSPSASRPGSGGRRPRAGAGSDPDNRGPDKIS